VTIGLREVYNWLACYTTYCSLHWSGKQYSHAHRTQQWRPSVCWIYSCHTIQLKAAMKGPEKE